MIDRQGGGENMKSCTESAIRSRLRRRGYRLIKHFNGWEEGYMVVDVSTYVVVYGHDNALETLEDVSTWIEEN